MVVPKAETSSYLPWARRPRMIRSGWAVRSTSTSDSNRLPARINSPSRYYLSTSGGLPDGIQATVTPSCASVSSVDQSSTTAFCGCTGTSDWPLEWLMVTDSACTCAVPNSMDTQIPDTAAKRETADSMITPGKQL